MPTTDNQKRRPNWAVRTAAALGLTGAAAAGYIATRPNEAPKPDAVSAEAELDFPIHNFTDDKTLRSDEGKNKDQAAREYFRGWHPKKPSDDDFVPDATDITPDKVQPLSEKKIDKAKN